MKKHDAVDFCNPCIIFIPKYQRASNCNRGKTYAPNTGDLDREGNSYIYFFHIISVLLFPLWIFFILVM